MSALDDFIAEDSTNRDFVDLMSDVRWTKDDIRNRTEALIEQQFTQQAQRILGRKVDAYTLSKVLALSPDPELSLPPFVLSSEEKADVRTLGMRALLCGMLLDFMWARAQRLSAALDYEGARNFLASLPPVPDDGEPDMWADARTALQAVVDAATQDTRDLVALRDAR